MTDDKENPYRKVPKGETADARKTRQAKFYHQQRIDAEETGDQGTVNKIYGKLGKKSLVGARKGDTSLNVDEKTTDKAALGTVAALAGGGGAIRAGARLAGRAAKAAAPALGAAARKALPSGGGKNIPDGEAMAKPPMRRAGTSVAETAGKPTRPVAKSASVRKLPGTVNRLPASEQRSLPSGGRKQIPEGSAMPSRSLTSKARNAKELPRSAPSQKALPSPKGDSPKYQHTKARAGSQRSQQSTSRNAGTNPRAVRSSKMKADQKAGKATESKDMLRTLKESVRQAKAKKKAA